jgi:hypothetical protein
VNNAAATDMTGPGKPDSHVAAPVSHAG